jgi:2-oxo-4-hydroxy-4-carboxy--5-ureidoimidazoline (OHCU) decarboxylase
MDPAASINALIGFLQILILAAAAFGARQLWNNSISLARIETQLTSLCVRTADHEERLRAIENHPDLAA